MVKRINSLPAGKSLLGAPNCPGRLSYSLLHAVTEPSSALETTIAYWQVVATHAVIGGKNCRVFGAAVSPAGQHEPPLRVLCYRLALVSTIPSR